MSLINYDRATVVSAGPDWFTATGTDPMASAGLLAVWNEWVKSQALPGEKPGKWAKLGYRGHTLRGVSAGVRNDNEAIVMASGKAAHMLSPGALPETCYITRFDVQVTIELEKPYPSWAMLLYHHLTAQWAEQKRPRYLKLIQSPTGDTLYVNKRTSPVMLRFYDKSREYGNADPGTFWRYEVEYKRPASQAAYHDWVTAKNHLEWAISTVAGEFAKRGITASWNRELPFNQIQVTAVAKTPASKLRWLVACVRPVVIQLIDQGFFEQVIGALAIQKDDLEKD